MSAAGPTGPFRVASFPVPATASAGALPSAGRPRLKWIGGAVATCKDDGRKKESHLVVHVLADPIFVSLSQKTCQVVLEIA
jgi:hypothetical protein